MQGAVLQHPRLADCYTEVVMKPPTGFFVWLIMLPNFQLALEQGTSGIADLPDAVLPIYQSPKSSSVYK